MGTGQQSLLGISTALPVPLTDLVLWVESDFGVYSDLGTTPAVDGATVEQWNDKSGHGYNFLQTTSGSRPLYNTNQVNSLPGIYCNAKLMGVATNSDLAMNTDSTVLMVVKAVSLAVDHNALISKDNFGSAGAYFYYLEQTTGKPTIDRPFIEAGVPATTGVGTANWRVLSARISGTTVNHWLDGATNGSDTLATGTATVNPFYLCNYANGTFQANIRVAAMLVYKTAQSTANRQSGEDYLGAKYAITITH